VSPTGKAIALQLSGLRLHFAYRAHRSTKHFPTTRIGTNCNGEVQSINQAAKMSANARLGRGAALAKATKTNRESCAQEKSTSTWLDPHSFANGRVYIIKTLA
jgi:hypothetical protein